MEDRKRVFKSCQLRQLASYSYIIVDHCVCYVCQKGPSFEFLKHFNKKFKSRGINLKNCVFKGSEVILAVVVYIVDM